MSDASLISIVIPAFNCEHALERAVRSCFSQTHPSIEVIVVDDCSTDGTFNKASGLTSAFPRLKVVKHSVNQGPLEGRRTGVQSAAGEFVMFLDCDDELSPEACAAAIKAQAGKFDIVQFGIEMRYQGYVSPREKWMDEHFNKAPNKAAYGQDVTHVTFLERLGTWSMCAKLFRKGLLEEAFEKIPPQRLLQAEDAYNYFVVSTLAESFKGLPNVKGYLYNIDTGGSNAKGKNLTVDQYKSFCTFSKALEGMKTYLSENDLLDTYQADFDTVYREHLMNLSYRLVNEVAIDAKHEALDELCSLFPAADVAGCLAEASWEGQDTFLKNFGGAPALSCKKREIKTVAAYHNVMGVGGAERVLADLANLWVNMGYNVVILCDEEQESSHYHLSPEISWVTLPKSGGMAKQDYLARARAIAQAVESHHIDAIVNHQWWSPVLAWDMISFKLMNVPFVVYCHNVFRVLLSESGQQGFDQPLAFRYADGLVTMTDIDSQFWKAFNPRIWQTIDPLTLLPDNDNRASLDSKEVVWVGRVSINDKQPHEALEIISRVAQIEPDCHLTIVGPHDDKRYFKRLQSMVKDRGIEANVTFAGSQSDVIPFYKGASTLLITSRYEGYCLVLAEAKALGIPTVTYDMPYLALMKGNRGIVSVPQGNQDAAAEALLDLLQNDQKRQRLGQEAFEHIEELSHFDFKGLWKTIFSDLECGSPDRSGFAESDALWDMTLQASKENLAKATNPSILGLANMNKQKGVDLARKAWHKLKWG